MKPGSKTVVREVVGGDGEETTGSFVTMSHRVSVTDSRGSPENMSGFIPFLPANGECGVCTANNRRVEFLSAKRNRADTRRWSQ